MAHLLTPRTSAASGSDARDHAARMGRVALATQGLLYLVVALLAVAVARGDRTAEPSQTGALESIARQPFGRVLLIAPAQEPVLTRSGADWMPSFIELLQHKMFPDGDPARRALEATSLIGALTALFTGYLNGKLPVTREQFVDYCVDMLLSRVPSRQ